MVPHRSLASSSRPWLQAATARFLLSAVLLLSATGHTMAQVFEGQCTQFEKASDRIGGGRLARRYQRLLGDLDQRKVYLKLGDDAEIDCLFAGMASPFHPKGQWRCGEFYYNILGYEAEQGVFDRRGELWTYKLSRSDDKQTCEVSADGNAVDKQVVELWFQERYNNKSLYVRTEDHKFYRLVTPSF